MNSEQPEGGRARRTGDEGGGDNRALSRFLKADCPRLSLSVKVELEPSSGVEGRCGVGKSDLET